MEGMAAGSTTRLRVVVRDAPIIKAARTQFLSTSRAPCVALMTIG